MKRKDIKIILLEIKEIIKDIQEEMMSRGSCDEYYNLKERKEKLEQVYSDYYSKGETDIVVFNNNN